MDDDAGAVLDRLLAGIDPGDRAEVMSGVREHLDTALPGSNDLVLLHNVAQYCPDLDEVLRPA